MGGSSNPLYTQLLGSNRCRATAYHPSANGLVERLHRQIKSALRAQQDPSKWTEALPLIMLGIRTALKEDLQCSTAELMYGTTLRLPGEFFDPSTSSTVPDPVSYVTQLQLSCLSCGLYPLVPNSVSIPTFRTPLPPLLTPL